MRLKTTNIATVFFLQLFFVIQSSSGLQCYKCSYFHADSDSNILSIILSQIRRLSDTHCKLDTRQDYEEVLMRQCPPPDNSGEEMKCVTLEGKTTTTIFSLQISVETVTRDCVSVPKNNAEYVNGCHDKLPQNSQVRGVLDSAFSGINKISDSDFGSTNFEGQTCYGYTNGSKTVYSGLIFTLVVALLSLVFLI